MLTKLTLNTMFYIWAYFGYDMAVLPLLEPLAVGLLGLLAITLAVFVVYFVVRSRVEL